jgi:hypothetical protein
VMNGNCHSGPADKTDNGHRLKAASASTKSHCFPKKEESGRIIAILEIGDTISFLIEHKVYHSNTKPRPEKVLQWPLYISPILRTINQLLMSDFDASYFSEPRPLVAHQFGLFLRLFCVKY